MRAQEGIQYRRVRKIAELSNRAEGETVDRSINNTTFSKGGKAIAPRFYPISQQKYRRTSVDVAYKKQLRASEM